MAASSAVAVHVVRQRAAAALEALDGWTESRYVFDSLGTKGSPFQHMAFAVGIPATATHPTPGRRRISEGLLSGSRFQVKVGFRIKVDDQVASYDAALTAEREAIGAILENIDRAGLSGVVWDDSSRTSPEKGWIQLLITFTAVHRI